MVEWSIKVPKIEGKFMEMGSEKPVTKVEYQFKKTVTKMGRLYQYSRLQSADCSNLMPGSQKDLKYGLRV